MRELVEARIKTIPADIDTLRNEYNDARSKLAEIREEIRRKRMSKPD